MLKSSHIEHLVDEMGMEASEIYEVIVHGKAIQGQILLVLAIIFAIVVPIFWFASYKSDDSYDAEDATGRTAILTLFYFLISIAVYYAAMYAFAPEYMFIRSLVA